MEKIIVGGIILSVILLGISIFRTYQYSKVRDKEIEDCKEYLDTVRNRANLSLNPEALRMLHNELWKRSETLKPNKEQYERFQQYNYYIIGKYQGLKKISKVQQ